MTTPLCIYHGNCADGFTAAWVVRQAIGNDVEFHPGIYGQPAPDCAGRDVLMVDFSYKRPVLMEMAALANSVLILDHHKTAAADLAGFPAAVEIAGEKIAAIFDMDRSGAQVTWDFFNPGKPRPLLVDYTGDRDLWRFSLPLSREVNAFVFAHEYTFENWDHLERQTRHHMDIQRVAEMGGAIERKHHKDIAELVGVMKRRMTIGGISVPVANLPYQAIRRRWPSQRQRLQDADRLGRRDRYAAVRLITNPQPPSERRKGPAVSSGASCVSQPSADRQ